MGRRLFDLVNDVRSVDDEVWLELPPGCEIHGLAPGHRVEIRDANGVIAEREVSSVRSKTKHGEYLVVRRTASMTQITAPASLWTSDDDVFGRFTSIDALLRHTFHPWPCGDLKNDPRRALLWRGAIVASIGMMVQAEFAVCRFHDGRRKAVLSSFAHHTGPAPAPDPVWLEDWDDPVERVLRTTPLVEDVHPGDVLDGFHYELEVIGEARMSLRFDNPLGGVLEQLMTALWSASRTIATAQTDPASRLFAAYRDRGARSPK